jgi:aminoglycoside phosphotransferase family enzyme
MHQSPSRIPEHTAATAPPGSDDAIKVSFLADASSYSPQPSRVEVIETHFAWVFLAGERAYKLKKATHLRGADWRSLEGREHACREELRLNRQISPATYLAVEPLVQTPAGLSIGGKGRVVDWLVVMQRLASARMLDSALTAHSVTCTDLESVLRFLVEFYRTRSPLSFSASAYLRRTLTRLDESVAALQPPRLTLTEDLQSLPSELRRAFELLRSQLAQRAEARHIVEGHGDLRAEHVWLGPPVQIIDALEAYADLRMLDTAEEIAMLAEECERSGAQWAAAFVRDRYRSLAADPCSDALLEFYEALRAVNRAKLAAWHLDDSAQFPDPAPWRERALLAAAAALRHARSSIAAAVAPSSP